MSGIRSLVVLSLAGLASTQAAFSNLEPCGTQCVNQVMASAGTFNCPASDYACLCGNVNWGNAIRDCAAGICPPGYAATVTSAASGMIAATLPVGAVVSTSAVPTTTSTPAPTSTPASSSASSSESSSEVSSTTPASSSSATTLETSTTSSATSTTTTAAAASTTSSTSAASSSSATAADAAATSSTAADTSDQPAGLTEAAKIGIGIGTGAAIIALLSIAACIFLRRRKGGSAPPPTAIDRLKISHPMPTDENPYPNHRTSDYDIGGNELEMKSRRYEDMVPHTEPRQMV